VAEAQTVLGPVDCGDLGVTAMHEHVLVDGTSRRRPHEADHESWHEPVSLRTLAALRANPSLHRDNLVLEFGDMNYELSLLAASGTRSLLDVTALGLRGEIARLPELSRNSGINIIASTGFYSESRWPAEIHGWDEPQFKKHMSAELTGAVEGTEFIAGHVKCGANAMSAKEIMSLRASAAIAAEYGVSLTVHPSLSDPAGPVRIAQIAMASGLRPERLVVAHCDGFMTELSLPRLVEDPGTWNLRLDKVRELLGLGVTASIDCFGHSWSDEARGHLVEADWQRLAGLVQLLREGYAAQIVLSCDVAKKMLTRRYGGHGYTRVNDWVVPSLLRHGVAQSHIDQMLVRNPARILARQ
jgi:phosphotriesterase-related protein